MSCAIWDPAVEYVQCTEQLDSLAEHASQAWPLLLELANVVATNGHLDAEITDVVYLIAIQCM